VEDLTPRRRAILESVVREFIATATPIGSKTIAERCGLGLSPATIRNELAYLEERGYLTHPYTSAGRIPTDEGYRYFVEHLMEEVELPPAERQIIRDRLYQMPLEMGQWLRLAAAVLSQIAESAALVAAPHPPRSRFKHLKLISLHGSMALLILVLQGGMVKQRMLTLARPYAQAELNRTASQLNSLFEGRGPREIAMKLPQLSPLGKQVAASVMEVMKQVGEWANGEIYRGGLANLLHQPEFATVENARRLVNVWEERSILKALMAEASDLAMGKVQVIIGKESPWDEFKECSLVLARYGVDESASGALGVIGPKRMAYERVISAVRYVADLMSDMVRRLYGNHA